MNEWKHILVIAEAGVNHNGDLELARQLIDAAANAGADYVKFQTFKAERLVTATAPKAEYQKSTTGVAESQYEMIRKLELDVEAHQQLIKHCKKRRIRFLSTAFDLESIDLLIEMGVDLFKIPSGEITNLPYLRKIAKTGKPVILSTGMATLGEIEDAIKVLTDSGCSRDDLTILHCNTQYPTPMRDVNLRTMQTIADAFKVAVGYSDHTLGIEIPIAATALGACVIEKHFTLDRNMEGPDHAASLEPQELKEMVSAIRNVEQALGDGIKLPSKSEYPNRAIARKSIVAAKSIRTGELFSETNLTAKRPGTGISPMRWDEMMGKQADRDYEPDELIDA